MKETYVIMLEKVPGVELSDEAIKRHIAHLRNLDDKGHLVLCGPFSDHPSGMVVINADNKNQAIEIAQSDPFVAEGVRNCSVYTWNLANRENNYLG